jgi:hypothetical protein
MSEKSTREPKHRPRCQIRIAQIRIALAHGAAIAHHADHRQHKVERHALHHGVWRKPNA